MMLATRPIRFVVGVVALWTGARAWMLWPGPIGMPARAAKSLASSRRPVRSIPLLLAKGIPQPARYVEPIPQRMPLRGVSLVANVSRRVASRADDAISPASTRADAASQPSTAFDFASRPLTNFPAAPSHWSGSAWAYWRHDGAHGLATGGQLGGSQAGARVLYRPLAAVPVALAMRLSRPLEQKGGEASVGVDWQALPQIRFAIERRIKLERGGRDAWGAFAAGGVYDRHLAGLRLDGYAQAGIVGAHAHDLFADGAVRIGREIGPVTIGAGIWGAAQPHVERLDIGPQAVARVPISGTTLSAAVDWRFRVAGAARPGSGPALTIGFDF